MIEDVEKVYAFIEKHPEVRSSVDYYEMSREEKLEVWWRRIRVFMESEEMSYVFTKNSEKN